MAKPPDVIDPAPKNLQLRDYIATQLLIGMLQRFPWGSAADISVDAEFRKYMHQLCTLAYDFSDHIISMHHKE